VARFELDEASNVVLALFDLRGGEVKQWRLGELAAGAQERPLDLSGLAPGSYVALLRAQGQGSGFQAVFKLALRP
jgi:hypothetical protein